MAGARAPLRSRLPRAARGRPRTAVLAAAGLVRHGYGVPGRVHVLCYHDVTPTQADGFRATLAALRDAGTFVGWAQALAVLRGERAAATDRPLFCLSFDDGYPGWRDVVLPTLEELALPAMFFVVTGLVEGRPDAAVSWDDCRRLVAAGLDLGSHSSTHRPLAALDDAEARRELRGSKAEIEQRTGRPVLDFCAPFGQPGRTYLPERDEALAAEAGYRSLATTVRGSMAPGDSVYRIRRFTMEPSWSLPVVRGRLRT